MRVIGALALSRFLTIRCTVDDLIKPLPVTPRYPGIAYTHHCGAYIERLSLLLPSMQTNSSVVFFSFEPNRKRRLLPRLYFVSPWFSFVLAPQVLCVHVCYMLSSCSFVSVSVAQYVSFKHLTKNKADRGILRASGSNTVCSQYGNNSVCCIRVHYTGRRRRNRGRKGQAVV